MPPAPGMSNTQRQWCLTKEKREKVSKQEKNKNSRVLRARTAPLCPRINALPDTHRCPAGTGRRCHLLPSRATTGCWGASAPRSRGMLPAGLTLTGAPFLPRANALGILTPRCPHRRGRGLRGALPGGLHGGFGWPPTRVAAGPAG